MSGYSSDNDKFLSNDIPGDSQDNLKVSKPRKEVIINGIVVNDFMSSENMNE